MTTPRPMRDELASVIAQFFGENDSPTDAADAVLAYLGSLDPSADPALIAWHLRNDADEIASLRARLSQAATILQALAAEPCRNQVWVNAPDAECDDYPHLPSDHGVTWRDDYQFKRAHLHPWQPEDCDCLPCRAAAGLLPTPQPETGAKERDGGPEESHHSARPIPLPDTEEN